MDNVQFCHILLRTNEAHLDLILGPSGCLDFLVSAFTFVITSLGNSPFHNGRFCDHGCPKASSHPRILHGHHRNSVLAEIRFCVPSPSQVPRGPKHNMQISPSTYQQGSDCSHCYKTHFLSFFVF